MAWAHNAYPIWIPVDGTGNGDSIKTLDIEGEFIPGQNIADTVICAPGEVHVTAWEGSQARIKSRAGNKYETESDNQASTQVYASDVKVNVSSLQYGQGIWAYAAGSGSAYVPYDYCMTEDGVVAITDGTATLIIDDYSKRKDCPECPPCPCEEGGLLAPVAPLPPYEFPRIEGCPALTQAAATELGIAGQTLQIAIGKALALNPNIQPCQACASLVSAANILRDPDGSRMAAMAYVFGQIAPAEAPFTPEMGAAIATAFSQNAETDPRFASAMEYIDAFAQYVTAADRDLGAPLDSTALVMEKYGSGLMDSGNSNMAAYVMMQMQQ
jgi:hypothetical protein